MIVFLSALLTIFSGTVVSVYADEPDYRYRRAVTYELQRRDSVWTVRSRETVTQVYLTQRSLRETRFWEYGSYFNPIVSLEAELTGEEIDEDLIKSVTPDYRDTFLNDDKAFSITMPRALVLGDSLHYVVEREWTDATYLPVHRVPNYHTTSEYSIEIVHPSSMRVDFTVVPARSNATGTVDRSKPGRTRITFTDLTYLPSLMAYPFDGTHAYVAIEITEGGKHITKNHPADFGPWYLGLFDQRCDLSGADRLKILGTMQNARTALDTIRAVYDHVRRTVRYVADERGKNSYVPRMPSTVVRQGYGDCKDRAHFVSSLLRSLGYTSGMALIHSEPRPRFTNTVAMSMFNHVIAYAIVDGDTIFMDPTAQFIPFGNLPEMDIDRQVFLVHTDPPQWSRTSVPQQEASIEVRATVDPADLTAARAVIKLRNDMAMHVLSRRGVTSPTEMSTMVASMIAGELSKIKVVDPVVDGATDSVVTVLATLDLRSFFVKGAGTTYCPLAAIRSFDAGISDRTKDTLSVVLGDRTNVDLRLRFTRDVQLQDTSFALDGPAGSRYSVATSRDEAGLPVISYRLIIGAKRFDGADRRAMIDFLQLLLRARRGMVAMKGL